MGTKRHFDKRTQKKKSASTFWGRAIKTLHLRCMLSKRVFHQKGERREWVPHFFLLSRNFSFPLSKSRRRGSERCEGHIRKQTAKSKSERYLHSGQGHLDPAKRPLYKKTRRNLGKGEAPVRPTAAAATKVFWAPSFLDRQTIDDDDDCHGRKMDPAAKRRTEAIYGEDIRPTTTASS